VKIIKVLFNVFKCSITGVGERSQSVYVYCSVKGDELLHLFKCHKLLFPKITALKLKVDIYSMTAIESLQKLTSISVPQSFSFDCLAKKNLQCGTLNYFDIISTELKAWTFISLNGIYLLKLYNFTQVFCVVLYNESFVEILWKAPLYESLCILNLVITDKITSLCIYSVVDSACVIRTFL
jgi:hypothetical protein